MVACSAEFKAALRGAAAGVGSFIVGAGVALVTGGMVFSISLDLLGVAVGGVAGFHMVREFLSVFGYAPATRERGEAGFSGSRSHNLSILLFWGSADLAQLKGQTANKPRQIQNRQMAWGCCIASSSTQISFVEERTRSVCKYCAATGISYIGGTA